MTDFWVRMINETSKNVSKTIPYQQDGKSLAASKLKKALEKRPNLDSCSPHSPTEGLICLQIPYESLQPITQTSTITRPSPRPIRLSRQSTRFTACFLYARSTLASSASIYQPRASEYKESIGYIRTPRVPLLLLRLICRKTIRHPHEGTRNSPQYTHTQSAQP